MVTETTRTLTSPTSMSWAVAINRFASRLVLENMWQSVDTPLVPTILIQKEPRGWRVTGKETATWYSVVSE